MDISYAPVNVHLFIEYIYLNIHEARKEVIEKQQMPSLKLWK